jgi:hypothetical protein
MEKRIRRKETETERQGNRSTEPHNKERKKENSRCE